MTASTLNQFKAVFVGRIVNYVGSNTTRSGDEVNFRISWNDIDCQGEIVDVVKRPNASGSERLFLLVRRLQPEAKEQFDQISPHKDVVKWSPGLSKAHQRWLQKQRPVQIPRAEDVGFLGGRVLSTTEQRELLAQWRFPADEELQRRLVESKEKINVSAGETFALHQVALVTRAIKYLEWLEPQCSDMATRDLDNDFPEFAREFLKLIKRIESHQQKADWMAFWRDYAQLKEVEVVLTRHTVIEKCRGLGKKGANSALGERKESKRVDHDSIIERVQELREQGVDRRQIARTIWTEEHSRDDGAGALTARAKPYSLRQIQIILQKYWLKAK
jgi:hypothetical protein